MSQTSVICLNTYVCIPIVPSSDIAPQSAFAAALDASRAARQAASERALQRRQYLEAQYASARQAGTAAIRSQ
jgi:hypothetical protein